MNDEITPPIDESSDNDGGIKATFSLWLKALTQPSVETYQEIGFSASDSTSKDYLTILTASIIQSLISIGLSLLLLSLFNISVLGDLGGGEMFGPLFGGGLFYIICMLPITVIFTTLMFALNTGLTHGVAKLLGGEGLYQHLLHARVAYVAPVFILYGVISSIPMINLFSLVIGIYVLVLHVISVKAIYQNEWWQAVVAGLATTVLWVTLWFICFISFFALFFTALSESGGF